MVARAPRRHTHSGRGRSIRDPPGHLFASLRETRRAPSGAEVAPVAPSASRRRWALGGAGEKREQRREGREADSNAATLCTSASTSEESSLSRTDGLTDCGDANGPIAAIATATAGDCGLHAVENEGGCDTAADKSDATCWASYNAVVCKSVSFASTLEQRCDQSFDQQENVQQIVNKILLEQAIARDAWNEVAEEYHYRVEPFTSSFVPHLLDSKHLASSPNNECHYLKGMSVLDVATGTGAGALYAASRGASSVMATDFSENMLRVLQNRIDDGNINQVQTHLASGLSLPLGWTNRYDVVLSNFGLIYFPKVQEGLLEMVRCAKPGGKVCVSGWGPNVETPAFGVFPTAIKLCGLDFRWRAVQRAARTRLLAATGDRRRGRGLAPNYVCPTTRISSSGGSLRARFAAAGLVDVRVVSVEKELQVDGDGYWDRYVRASPNLKRFVEHCLGPEEVRQLRETVSQLLYKESPNPQQGDGDDCIVLKASAYLAIGTKT